MKWLKNKTKKVHASLLLFFVIEESGLFVMLENEVFLLHCVTHYGRMM